MKAFVCLTLALVISSVLVAEAKKSKDKPEWAKKDIHQFNDHDLEKLYEQWEEDDEPLEPDELPDWDPRKPQPMIDFSKLDMSSPDNIMKATKKGKTIMLFAKVAGSPTRDETEQITSIWQTGLWNNHIQADRFLLEDDRVIFMFQDGVHAWDARDYLVDEEKCFDVQLEQKTYCGKHHPDCEVEVAKREAKEEKEKKKREKEREKKKKKEEAKKKREEEEARKKELEEMSEEERLEMEEEEAEAKKKEDAKKEKKSKKSKKDKKDKKKKDEL